MTWYTLRGKRAENERSGMKKFEPVDGGMFETRELIHSVSVVTRGEQQNISNPLPQTQSEAADLPCPGVQVLYVCVFVCLGVGREGVSIKLSDGELSLISTVKEK